MSSILPLDQFEIERCRYHLGYPEVQPAASIQYGIPRPIQTAFLFEDAVQLLIPPACDRVRRLIAIMDRIEQQMANGAIVRLSAIQLDEMKLRDNEPDQLEREYCRWGFRLADTLGVPVYAYSIKYRNGMGMAAGNISRRM